jgi:ABC-type dipeptide/oligopeptide/nickel transport system ATPase component
MDDDLKFKHPFTSIISGPKGSGKSTFCIRLLQNLKLLCPEQEFNGGIFWCFGERTAFPDRELSELNNTIRVHKGVTENFENKNGKPCLIILDDLLYVAYCKVLCNLFTKGSHHRNISVILITQNLFHKANYCRDISLNAKYSVLLKDVWDNQQFMSLARQVHPEGPNQL